MTESKRRKYYDLNKIHILKGTLSNKPCCKIRGCKKQDKYLVLVGGTQLSNLHGTSCPVHLSKVVDKAFDYRNKLVEEMIENADRKELAEAQRLILNTKLKKIKN